MWTITIVNGIAYGSLLFLLAAGFSMIFGVLKVINLAHGSLYLVGGYVTLSAYLAGIGFLPALAAGAAVGAFLGWLAERYLLYPLQGQYLPQVLVTMGLLLILGDASRAVWGGTPVQLTLPAILDGTVSLGAFSYPVYRLGLIGVGILAALSLWWTIDRTRFGATVRAAVEDEEIAQTVGISVPWLRIGVFATGGLLAGLAGGLGMPFIGARPGLDLEIFLLALVIVVVGGIGSLAGAYLAAMLIGVTDSLGKILFPEISLFMLFLPMLLILVLRPIGLFGKPLPIVEAASAPSRAARVFRQLTSSVVPLAIHLARLPRAGIIASLLALALAWPWLTSEYVTKLVALALVWSLFALGLNVILGFAGMPSLGHAAFFGTGAYAVAILARDAGLQGFVLLAAAVAVAAVVAAVLGLVAVRARLVYFLLATIALGQVLWGIAFKWRSFTGGDDGLSHGGVLTLGTGLGRAIDLYYAIAFVFAALAVVMLWVYRSRFRIVLNGLRDNEPRLVALGYDTWLYRYGAFLLSGALSGLAGALFAFHNGFVSPELLGLHTSAAVLFMVILGGAGTFWGPVVGAFILVFLEEGLSALTSYWQAVQGALFILIALSARLGLAGDIAVMVRRHQKQPAAAGTA
jgi:branched-chain amino acid transport system permease protein